MNSETRKTVYGFLMGGKFWDEIGRPGTFEDLLQVIDEVGNVLRARK